MSLVESAIKKLQAARGGSAVRESGGSTPPGSAPRPEAGEGPVVARVPTPTLALDQEGLRSAGLLPPLHQERELAQQFRHIERPLIHGALGHGTEPIPHGQVILVTSAAPGEGKTFISLNLALSLRLEEDATVLLIDGDVVNPRLSLALGAQRAPGLLDVIRDPSLSLNAVVLATDVRGLSFLPAGRLEADATELLASARMRELMSEFRRLDASRWVLFDSAPLLLTTESHVLAQVAGQILLVVCADLTPQQMVLDALHTLEEGKSVSLVLNQSTQPIRTGHYYPHGAAPRRKAQPPPLEPRAARVTGTSDRA